MLLDLEFTIFKSNRTIYAQAINDVEATTLCVSDGKVLGLKANKESATKLGADLADKLKLKTSLRLCLIEMAIFTMALSRNCNSLRRKCVKL